MGANPSIWTVETEFDNRDDATALVELLNEMGYATRLKIRRINTHRRPASELRVGMTVLAAMEPGRTYTIQDIAAALEEHKFRPKSASGILTLLVIEGKVLRVDRGLYELPR